jgi:tetratricopeptide (TPR) repeat protein
MQLIEQILQLIKDKKYDECLSKCERKLQIDPENSVALFGISFALFHKGEYDKSYNYAKKNLLKVREKDISVLLRMVEVYNLVSMNKYNEDMKKILDSLEKEKSNEDLSDQVKTFLIMYHIFNKDSESANEMYNEMNEQKKKEFLNFLIENVIKGKTAKIMKNYLNF